MFVVRLDAALPAFQGRQHFIPFEPRGPNRFALLQADFVLAFALAIFVPTKVSRGCNPHHAIGGTCLSSIVQKMDIAI